MVSRIVRAIFIEIFIMIGLVALFLYYIDWLKLHEVSEYTLFKVVLVGIVILISIALFLSYAVAKYSLRPIFTMGLTHTSIVADYTELAPIVKKINKQREEIEGQILELENRTKELLLVSSSMKEGLIFLNKKYEILSINTMAQQIFQTDETVLNQSFITVDRDIELNNALTLAQKKNVSLQIEREGKIYQVEITTSYSEGMIGGYIILIYDISDRAFAQRQRREFSANISHELKTPLQSILGSAELLKEGLVKEKDIQLFSENIYNQTSALINMVNDIIELSKLDENTKLIKEEVALYTLIKQIVADLEQSAKSKAVTVGVHGSDVKIQGVPRLLHQAIFNLIDNAIKYNTENGRVDIDIEKDEKFIRLSVKDTGIGIPKGDIDRIFERFYRVDKSRSSHIKGTGLGLSIAKHAFIYHGGKIKVESELGKGTNIVVVFER